MGKKPIPCKRLADSANLQGGNVSLDAHLGFPCNYLPFFLMPCCVSPPVKQLHYKQRICFSSITNVMIPLFILFSYHSRDN